MSRSEYILLALLLLLACCRGKAAEEMAASEQALNSYRDYVAGFAQDSLSQMELQALQQAKNDSVAWEEVKAQMQQEYEAQRKRLEEHQDHLSPEQRTEAVQLDQQYKNALEIRLHQYQDASHRYKLRRELLGMEAEKDDMSGITGDNIGPSFQRFASGVKRHAASYQNRDWQLIEDWWSALNSRYRELENSLPERVKKTVSLAQEQYQQVLPEEEVNGQETQKPQP